MAARKVHDPSAVAQTPSPGETSTASAVLSTVNVAARAVSGAARIRATTQTPVPARERPRWSMWDLQHIGQRCRRNLHGGRPRRLVPGSRARALRRWKATCPSESARGRAARYILAAEAEMNHRHLGQSGLMVSEIAYGNWLTHGAQVDKDAAFACVRAALEEGITTFDTAD